MTADEAIKRKMNCKKLSFLVFYVYFRDYFSRSISYFTFGMEITEARKIPVLALSKKLLEHSTAIFGILSVTIV